IHFSLPLVGLSALALGANMMMLVVTNRVLLSAVHQRLPWTAVAEAIWVSRLGKYIPGKVASVVGATYLLRRYGVPSVLGSGIVLLNTMLTVLVGLFVAGPLMLWGPVYQRLPLAWLWCLSLAVAVSVAVHPRIMLAMMNFVLHKMKRPSLAVRLDLRHYITPVLLIMVQWILAGVSLWLLAASVVDLSVRFLPLLIAASALANTMGFMALFAPGGLGVREFLYLVILSQLMEPGLASVVTVSTRLLYITLEVTLALTGLALRRHNLGTTGESDIKDPTGGH
ncbi:MAG: flippase-like domain-containing protein, partial [Planctomycetes bacterium]|nr:flippase-like domain-containing protein [Planctomycetota bacterium]